MTKDSTALNMFFKYCSKLL